MVEDSASKSKYPSYSSIYLVSLLPHRKTPHQNLDQVPLVLKKNSLLLGLVAFIHIRPVINWEQNILNFDKILTKSTKLYNNADFKH